MLQKFYEIDQLEKILDERRAKSQRIVHCHGVFDLLHLGHIRHFNEAKKLGDVLVVTLTADQYVNKGPHRPAFSQKLRAESLASLECVDFVAINDAPSAVEAIKKIKPNFYVKGKDYRDRSDTPGSNLKKEETTIIELGGQLVFTDDLMFSSSTLLNSFLNPFPEHIISYLRDLKQSFGLKEVAQLFEQFQNKKVLVVGESIVEEINYCEAVAKSAQEPVVVTRQKNSERLLGGSLLLANHLANFCKEVTLISTLGTQDDTLNLVKSKLNANIRQQFVIDQNRPTIVRRRYLDSYHLHKLFEVGIMNDSPLASEQDQKLCATLKEHCGNYDAVIVGDYGLGMLSRTAIDILCEDSKFLAVNLQANAADEDCRTISIYPRVNFVSLSESELCLDMRKRHGKVDEMSKKLTKRIDCNTICVNQSRHGIHVLDRQCAVTAQAPDLATQAVDRFGADEAILALNSLACLCDASPQMISFLATVAATEACSASNSLIPLQYKPLMKHVTSLLK